MDFCLSLEWLCYVFVIDVDTGFPRQIDKPCYVLLTYAKKMPMCLKIERPVKPHFDTFFTPFPIYTLALNHNLWEKIT